MSRRFVLLLVLVFVGSLAWAQSQSPPQEPPQDPSQESTQDSTRTKLPPPGPPAPPRSDQASSPESSSSKDTKIDLSPPRDDSKNHPFSSAGDDDEPPSDVQTFHPWDPHKAAKNVEVGDYYFKRKNYRAAEDRYREALLWKPNDAIATFRLAEASEKLGKLAEARSSFQDYLKILPAGPLSADAHKALQRLDKEEAKNK
jgi:tetratricopeptide (TPR) repeat protein